MKKIVFILSIFAASQTMAACEQSNEQYTVLVQQFKQAQASDADLIRKIEQSLASCERHIGLRVLQGDIYSKQQNWAQAVKSYEGALQYANIEAQTNPQQYMSVLFRLLSANLWKKDRFEASYLLTKIHAQRQQGVALTPQQEQTLKQADSKLNNDLQENPLSQNELTSLFSGNKRDFSLEPPALNYRISFDFDQDQPNAGGRKDIINAATAMLAPEVKSIDVIGHTDKQGDDTYNQQLSLRRAQAVVSLLVSQHPTLAKKLSASGKGEQALLYPGDSEDDHQLNRRVEFVFKR